MKKHIWYSSSHRHLHQNTYCSYPHSLMTHQPIRPKIQLFDRIGIIFLGLILGFIFALFIAYHLHFIALSYPILFFVPMMMSLFLYRVYAYTILHIKF